MEREQERDEYQQKIDQLEVKLREKEKQESAQLRMANEVRQFDHSVHI